VAAGTSKQRVLVALGGNAMSAPDGSATEVDQIAALTVAADRLADLVAAGFELAITHGNGPQVGNLLVKNELAAHVVPPVSLDWCVAQTQATIGFVLVSALEAALHRRGLGRPVVALVSRTLVDGGDPAFAAPSKPVGRYRPADEAARFAALGQTWHDFGTRGWRRVVASPRPVEVLDAGIGRTLLESGAVVVLGGGGGVPMVRDGDRLRGVEAVIDKDTAAGLLAAALACDILVIATDVEQVQIGFGTPRAQGLASVTVDEVRALDAAGEFGAGSMRPKVLAAADFAASGGRAVITSLELLSAALTASAGTVGTTVTVAPPEAS
jgi:carbamate kinase